MSTDLENVDEVEQHDTLFATPLRFFKPGMFNDTFTEVREDEVFCTPTDPYSNVYEFNRAGNAVGLIKTSEATISATVTLRLANDANSPATANLALPPLPLRTLFKTKELKLNESLVTPADNHGSYVSYLNFLMRNVPSGYKDSKEINLAYLDTSGHMNSLAGNPGRILRRNYIRNATKILIDGVDVACFSEGGGEAYIPTAFKIGLRFTRENLTRVCTGADDANNPVQFPVATAKLKIEDLKIKFPIFKPKQQIISALNIGLVNNNDEAKWYSTTYRCVTSNITAGREIHQENDIFNGATPVRLFIFFSPQANYNGSLDTNMFEFPWENYKLVDVHVNNASVGRIENSAEAYNNLRNMLNRKHDEMPITYDQYMNGYGILGFDLTPTRDTHLRTLPLRTNGTVSVHIDFTQATRAGVLFFVGEFRNEIKAGVKTPARLMFDY